MQEHKITVLQHYECHLQDWWCTLHPTDYALSFWCFPIKTQQFQECHWLKQFVWKYNYAMPKSKMEF